MACALRMHSSSPERGGFKIPCGTQPVHTERTKTDVFQLFSAGSCNDPHLRAGDTIHSTAVGIEPTALQNARSGFKIRRARHGDFQSPAPPEGQHVQNLLPPDNSPNLLWFLTCRSVNNWSTRTTGQNGYAGSAPTNVGSAEPALPKE